VIPVLAPNGFQRKAFVFSFFQSETERFRDQIETKKRQFMILKPY
jgi:hypothetical protein